MNFFEIETVSLWNGLGNVLITGITDSNSVYETMSLSRTGPYVPNICVVPIGRLVMTDKYKQTLEKSGFSQLSFRKVIIDKIVSLDWHTWDFSAATPKYLPKSYDPDDYIEQGIHNPEIAKAVGDVWECVLPFGGIVNAVPKKIRKWQFDFRLELNTWNGLDLFRTEENCGIYATDRAKDWLMQNDAKWLLFNELEID